MNENAIRNLLKLISDLTKRVEELEKEFPKSPNNGGRVRHPIREKENPK